MSNKFNVGDIIIGTPRSDGFYSITNSSCKCRVEKVDEERLAVTVIGGFNADRVFMVNENYFEHYKPPFTVDII